MPRIPDEIQNCSAYIYPSSEAAKHGEEAGASGFLVGVQLEKNAEYYQIYVVTNRHAIYRGKTKYIRLNRNDGEIQIFPIKKKSWLLHSDGDDLAVLPIDFPQSEITFSFVDVKHFALSGDVGAHGIGCGDDVFMVGRFIGHDGKQRNFPSIRFGNIAMMPNEKIRHPTFKIEQESYLVECRSIPGYSGSPVFMYKGSLVMLPQRYTGGLVSTLPQIPWLLGVDWCHLNDPQPVLDADGEPLPGGWRVRSNTGMAAVVPAWRLLDILNGAVLAKQRKHEDARISKNKENG
jgi:hypothetical protein